MKKSFESRKDFVLSVKDVCFSYNGSYVLENISFDLSRSEFLGILGPNGSGKTTLLKIILGLLNPTHGDVSVFGKEPASEKARSRVGYVPQRASFNLRFPASVEEVVGIGAAKGKKAAVDKSLRMVGITNLRKKRIGDLSGGQQEKVMIAKALAREPEMLVLDEPMGGVDYESQKNLYKIFQRIKKSGASIIIVSHDIGGISSVVDKILCVNKRMICYGSPRQTLRKISEMMGEDFKMLRHRH